MNGPGRAGRAAAALAMALVAGAAWAQPDGLRIDREDLPPAGPRIETDLDRVNPGIGFGWFGFSDVPVGGAAGATVEAPVLGIRWWMGAPLGPFRTWGLDLGLGLARTSSDAEPSDVTRSALVFHAGLPLVVSAAKHVAIVFVPEVNLGLASGQESGGADVGGSLFQVGARAGAEVFFGFVGLPQLSLEASVGLHLTRESRSVKPPGAAESDTITTSFGTSVQAQPWDLFRTSVAARYYF